MLQLAIVILKAQWKTFAMMQRASACAKKGLGVPDATNAWKDGLIIPTANLVNAPKKDRHRRFAMRKREIVPVIQITEGVSVTPVPAATLATPNVTLVAARPSALRAFLATTMASVNAKLTFKE